MGAVNRAAHFSESDLRPAAQLVILLVNFFDALWWKVPHGQVTATAFNPANLQ
jgi:hypothetical protein